MQDLEYTGVKAQVHSTHHIAGIWTQIILYMCRVIVILQTYMVDTQAELDLLNNPASYMCLNTNRITSA